LKEDTQGKKILKCLYLGQMKRYRLENKIGRLIESGSVNTMKSRRRLSYNREITKMAITGARCFAGP
jgi:hypothetical protein